MVDSSLVSKRHIDRYQAEPALFAAPGRVNLIGEHTDYAEGFVMPAAIDFAMTAAISPRDDGKVLISSVNFSEEVSHDAGTLPAKPNHHWSDYPLGVLTTLANAGIPVRGFSLTLSGDVPIGSGLSSSAAIEVATALAVLSVAGPEARTFSMPEIARLCQRAENEFVGTQSGIMDQFIACCGAANSALLLDCRDLSFRLAPVPENIAIVISNTMVKHSHAGGEYNTRRAQVEEGVRILRRYRPEIRVLRDVTLEELMKRENEMPHNVLQRCRHIVTENIRTVAAANALERGNLKQLGRLMAEAHASYRDDFEASCKEADILVDLAVKLPGCIGARLTGGGFGGCTVNLVDAAEASSFAAKLVLGYRQATDIEAEVYLCHASAGARRLQIG